MDIHLDDVGPEDAGELLTLQRAAFVQESIRHGVSSIPPLTQTFEELLSELESCIAIKATIGRRLVGSVRMRVEGDTGYVARLVVVPDLQGRGIGTMLMREIETRAPESVMRFEIFTGPKSVDTISLYKWLGYEEFKREKAPDGLELVFMEKTRSKH